jgi:pyruvate, water dikinase
MLWLGDPACADRALVGGKAANLSQLAARYPVPPGFCLTAAAFDRGALEDLVERAYASLAARCAILAPPVAVRSSADDEDGGRASFAGQLDTYLNVVGAAAIVDAVARCRASASSERVREYRRRRGLPIGDARLAVLVQRLVAADVAAVAFSVNPLTGAREEVVVDASWGLGEALVGGAVTPDSYVVRRRDLAVTERQVADKRRMSVLVPDGTKEVEVPRRLRQRPTLDDARVAAVARLALDLEATMGWPVDIECAFQGDQLYLLQCRPITALGSSR